MTDQRKQHSRNESVVEIEEFDYISEQCFMCEKELNNIKHIYVGVNDDRYYCLKCAKKYNIEVVKCLDIDLCDLMCSD